MWWLMDGERKGLKLAVWACLTLFIVLVLITGNGNTVSVVCGVFVVTVGVLTIALILTGHSPPWTETRKARQAWKKRGH